MGLFANFGGAGAGQGIMNASSMLGGGGGGDEGGMGHPQQGNPEDELRKLIARLMGHQQQPSDGASPLGGGGMGGMMNQFGGG